MTKVRVHNCRVHLEMARLSDSTLRPVWRGLMGDTAMTPKQIQLVRSSWTAVAPIQQQAAAMFYDKLFAADPSLRALFKSDMQEQQRKLMGIIGVVVAALDRLETIVPAVRELGRRHATYGVRAAHYAVVATALLATLEQGLGAAFTVDVREAWTAAYGILASTMQSAASTG
jgi:hemoglobin-like flavoprotein